MAGRTAHGKTVAIGGELTLDGRRGCLSPSVAFVGCSWFPLLGGRGGGAVLGIVMMTDSLSV
jgi:hypothetical protein